MSIIHILLETTLASWVSFLFVFWALFGPYASLWLRSEPLPLWGHTLVGGPIVWIFIVVLACGLLAYYLASVCLSWLGWLGRSS